MKTLGSLAAIAAVVINASLTMGCGCDPGNNSQRAPIDFTPSSSDAFRTPAACGSTSFAAGDVFTLELLGETDIAPPYTVLRVDLGSSVVVGQSVPLMVGEAAGNVTTAKSNDRSIRFSLTNGSNAAELDVNPLASVVVNVTSMPTADGQPLSAELQLTFEDGRVLDQSYSAPLKSVVVSCLSHQSAP